MSSILDALKKSEADRQRAAGPTLLDLHVQPRRRRLPAWAIALGVLLVGNVALLAWLGMRHPPAPGAGTQAGGAAQPTPLPAAPIAAAPTAAGQPPAPQPAATTAPGATMPGGVAADGPANGAPDGAVRGARMPAGADAGDNPADEAPAVEPAPRRARAGAGQGALQNYSALSATLPPLHLDLHFWSEAPAERYALINLHRVGEGDTLPEGPRVLEITREGVVMEYEGREFVLGRE